MQGKKGKIKGTSKIANEITARVKAEKERQLFAQRLQELNTYKDEFMIMASHELKTPLTVIMANLQILEIQLKDDERISFVKKTITQAQKLAGLITNLFDVSKIQLGKLILNFSELDINVLIEEIISTLQQTAIKHDLILDKASDKLLVNADRERIEQVLINVIGNAIKYSDENKDVQIKTFRNGLNVEVVVIDQGIGIAEKEIENVFQRFYHGSGSVSTYSGSGVGLYISSEIIKSHGGKIWVESEAGNGSAFHISIPALP